MAQGIHNEVGNLSPVGSWCYSVSGWEGKKVIGIGGAVSGLSEASCQGQTQILLPTQAASDLLVTFCLGSDPSLGLCTQKWPHPRGEYRSPGTQQLPETDEKLSVGNQLRTTSRLPLEQQRAQRSQAFLSSTFPLGPLLILA